MPISQAPQPTAAIRGRLFWFDADPEDAGDAAARYVEDGLLTIAGGHVAAVGEASALLKTLPADAPFTAAFSLAGRYLAEQKTPFEFLPPKPSLIEIFAAKYASGRLRTAGAVGAGVVLLVGGLFLYQQIQLWSLRSQWAKISAGVTDLQNLSANIQQYRPWYDTSFPNLSILRQLTLAFPEDGTVTAKTIEIRDGNTISCSGTAHDMAALLSMQKQLAATPGVTGLHFEQGRGKTPVQFVLSFHFNQGAMQ